MLCRMLKPVLEAGQGVFCSFSLCNHGFFQVALAALTVSPLDWGPIYLYGLRADVNGVDRCAEVRNALAIANVGETIDFRVADGASADAAAVGTVALTAVSSQKRTSKPRRTCSCKDLSDVRLRLQGTSTSPCIKMAWKLVLLSEI